MKRNLKVVISSCAILLAFSTVAWAAGGYVSGSLGVVKASDSTFTDTNFPEVPMDAEFDAGPVVALAIGKNLMRSRLEIEFAFQRNNFDKVSVLGSTVPSTGDQTTRSLLINGYYDFATIGHAIPFISAGVGVAEIDVTEFFTEDDTVLAYQFGGGVSFAFSENITIETKYRYFAVSDPKFDTTEADMDSHCLLLGVRMGF